MHDVSLVYIYATENEFLSACDIMLGVLFKKKKEVFY